MNDSGTSGSNCAETVPQGVAGKMRFVRAQVGADTPHGHAISNTIEILENRRTYVRPEWATHDSQTLSWRLGWQADRQESLSFPKGDRA